MHFLVHPCAQLRKGTAADMSPIFTAENMLSVLDTGATAVTTSNLHDGCDDVVHPDPDGFEQVPTSVDVL